MDLDDLFVLNLKKWRKNRGLSQKTLAERCNAAHSYIRQIESGSGHPSFAFIGKLADALHIEPYELFYNKEAAQSVSMLWPESLEQAEASLLLSINRELHFAFERLKQQI